ncbi:DUF4190 domain-containing protein [Actinotalea sp. AC32]|nr:DUF4190 domain-containing protein [Actinotalea sp. AC32]
MTNATRTDSHGDPLSPSHGEPRPLNGMAVLALVLSVVGGPLAIPFGHIALRQVAATGARGRRLALAGLVIGYIALVVILALVVAPVLWSVAS